MLENKLAAMQKTFKLAMLKKRIFEILFVFSIFTIDRISKFIILSMSHPLGELDIFVTSILNFNLLWNRGIAFGLLSFEKISYYNLITLIIILITLLVTWISTKCEGLEKKGFLMIVGGSTGNIFDRLYYSSVIDFIDININNFHWFIFNVSDIFITLGVIVLISVEFFKIKKK